MPKFKAAVTQTINQYDLSQVDLDLVPEIRDEVILANLDHNIALIRQAARQGARVICLGEFFNTPYFPLEKQERWRSLSTTLEDSISVRCLQDLSKTLDLVIIAPIFERDSGTGMCYSTAIVIEEGKALGKYRKNFVPNGSNELAGFHEGFYITGSNGTDSSVVERYPVFETRFGKIGVIICFDRHFPETLAQLAARGAELVFCPAVTFGRDSRRLWKKEFEVDAARYNVVIGASNRKGREAPWNVEFFGESVFMGPGGELLNLSNHPEIVLAELDICAVRASNNTGWHLSAHRKKPD